MRILTINSGSSSLKAALFLERGGRHDFRYEKIGSGGYQDHEQAFNQLMFDLEGGLAPQVIAHRFVHGGDTASAARWLDDAEINRLHAISHLAPLHMPLNLLGVSLCSVFFKVPQIACFDTAFHHSMPEIAWRLPIPSELHIRRYGFHGINYAHIARQLPIILGQAAYGNIVVAHLGNGASLCLMRDLKSEDTTMGYSTAGGIPMGTRSGDLDPGVMLELSKRFDDQQLQDLVYHKMGLLALSDGESSDMSELLKSKSESGLFAIDYFCRQVRAAIGGLAAKAGQIDGLVFTAGIGERSPLVRAKICEKLSDYGFVLDTAANQSNKMILNKELSKPILVISADEEAEMAAMTRTLV